MIDRIDGLCSFQNMKRDPTVNPDLVLQFKGEDNDYMSNPALPADSSFMRKGDHQFHPWPNQTLMTTL